MSKELPQSPEARAFWGLKPLQEIKTRAPAAAGNNFHASRAQGLTTDQWTRKTLDIGSKRFADGIHSTPSQTHTLHQAQAERVAGSIHVETRKKLDRMFENFRSVELWRPYEILELLKQGVDLAEVTIPWLDQFREDLDLQV